MRTRYWVRCDLGYDGPHRTFDEAMDAEKALREWNGAQWTMIQIRPSTWAVPNAHLDLSNMQGSTSIQREVPPLLSSSPSLSYDCDARRNARRRRGRDGL